MYPQSHQPNNSETNSDKLTTFSEILRFCHCLWDAGNLPTFLVNLCSLIVNFFIFPKFLTECRVKIRSKVNFVCYHKNNITAAVHSITSHSVSCNVMCNVVAFLCKCFVVKLQIYNTEEHRIE